MPEHHLKKISGAATAHVVNSGMTALDLILRLVKPGETVLAGDDIYGGSNRLLGWAGTDGGLVRRRRPPFVELPWLGCAALLTDLVLTELEPPPPPPLLRAGRPPRRHD